MRRKSRRAKTKRAAARKEPLAEGIVPLDKRGRRRWKLVGDEQLEQIAQHLIDKGGFSTLLELRTNDAGLHEELRKRGFLGRVELAKKGKEWSPRPVVRQIMERREELIRQGLPDEEIMKAISAEMGIPLTKVRTRVYKYKADGRFRMNPHLNRKAPLPPEQARILLQLREQLFAEGLTDKAISHRAGEILGWPSDKLYHYITRLVRKGDIEQNPNMKGWQAFTDEDIGRIRSERDRLIEEGLLDSTISGIIAKGMGRIHGSVQHLILGKAREGEFKQNPNRKFSAPKGTYSNLSDEQMLEMLHEAIHMDGLESRTQLWRKHPGLAEALRVRGLLSRMLFKKDERVWRLYSDEALLDYSRKRIAELGVSSRTGLHDADRGLYWALRRRDLMDEFFSDIEGESEALALKDVMRALKEFGDT